MRRQLLPSGWEAGRGAGDQGRRWGGQGPYSERSSGLEWECCASGLAFTLSLSLLTQCVVSTISLNLSSPASVSYSVKWVEDHLCSLYVVRISCHSNVEALRTCKVLGKQEMPFLEVYP